MEPLKYSAMFNDGATQRNILFSRLASAVALAAAASLLLGFTVWTLGGLIPVPSPPVGLFPPHVMEHMKPEPGENFTFIVLCLAAPLISFGAVFIAQKIPVKFLLPPWSVWLIPALALWSIGGSKFHLIYFEPMIPWWPLAAALATGLCCLCRKFRAGKWERMICAGLIVFLPVLSVLFSRIYTTHNLHQLFIHHLDIVAYAIAQAAGGGNDFHQYGGYIYMLAPVFRLFGSGVFSISVVMGVLYIAGFALLFLPLLRIGRPIYIAGAAVLLFIAGCWAALDESLFDPYFAYFPIRFIGPAMAVALFVQGEKKRRTSKYIDAAYGAFAAVSLFWNFDSGVAVAGAFIFFELILLLQSKFQWRSLLFFAGSFVIAAIAGIAWLTWHLGAFSGLGGMFFANRFFVQYGFYMLPMPPLPHLWGLVVLQYLIGLVVGAYEFRTCKESLFGKTVVFISVMGLGLLLYYIGRSHDFNLVAVSWPAVLLFALYAGRGGKALQYCMVFLMIMGCGTLILNYRGIANGIRKLCVDGNDVNPIKENTQFIMLCANGRDKVNILGYAQGIFYAESGLRPAVSNCGEIEPKDNAAWNEMLHKITLSDAPLFLSIGPAVDLRQYEKALKRHRVVSSSRNKAMFYLERVP